MGRFAYLNLKGESWSTVCTEWSFFTGVCMLSLFSRVRLFVTLWTVAVQAPLSMGFSRQEYWSGLPCPPLGDLPYPGIEPMPPALAGRFFTTEPLGKHNVRVVSCFIWVKMRMTAWETAPQIALRDCSKEAVGRNQYIRFWWRGSSV